MPRQSLGPRLVRRNGKPSFYVRYIDETTGKPKDLSTGTRDSVEAQEFLEDFMRERRLARSGQAKAPNRVKIADVMDRFHQQLVKEGRGDRFYHSMVHILAFWKDDCLNRITPALVSDYVRTNIRDNEGDGRSRATIRRELSDMRAAVNHAIREHMVRPIVFPRLPRDGAPRTRWLVRDEFDRMFAEAANEYRTAEPLQRFLMIAYYTGARSGAIVDLRWDKIDFDRNIIDFTVPDDGGLEVKRKPRAVTPMAPPLRQYLLKRFQEYDEVPDYVLHQKKDPKRRVKSVAKGFRATAARLGLVDVSPHTLRHTRVSELRNMGMHSHQVDAFLAMSEQTQNRVYTHAREEDLQSMAALIS